MGGGGMSAPAAAPSAGDYGLPAAGDEGAWRDLMRPCGGILQLYKAPVGMARTPKLVPVRVWVHCGLHYVPAPVGIVACTAPVPEDLPLLSRPDTHYRFFPLRRDEPGPRPSFSVRTYCAPADGNVRGFNGRWVLELKATADTRPPLCFCAGSKVDALAWERQLRMRSAPLAVVWSRHVGMAGGGSASGVGVVGAEPAGPSWLAAVAAVHGGARCVLGNDVLAGAAGMATALTREAAHDVAVAAGPVVGVAFAGLGVLLRFLAAMQSVAGVALDVSADLNDLCVILRDHLLPALRDLPDDGRVQGLITGLGGLVADMEVIFGELHHLVRSRRARVRVAASSVFRVLEVGADFRVQLSHCRRRADEILQLCPLALHRGAIDATHQTQQAVISSAEQTRQVVIASAEVTQQAITASAEVTRQEVSAAGPRAIALEAAQKELPPLPPNVYINWEDRALPAARLFAAVIKADSTTCAAVGVRGMGGVGKTLSCLLVAHRIATEAAGQDRFPDGVHWMQLSSEVCAADVTQRVCDLATALSGDAVLANDLDVAVGRLRTVLEAKSCLVIVDDVWEHQWAAKFIKAMGAATGSCLLISTRQLDIATRAGMSEPVSVDVLQGAAASGVLSAHAEAGGVTQADRTDGLVQEAVSLCGGLALALAVMGSLVLSLGWAPAVMSVRCQRDILLSTCLHPDNNYDLSLRACLSASYKALGADVDEQELWRGRFKALCVVRPKEQLPLSALVALWGEDEGHVVLIAKMLRDRSLVTLQGDEGGDSLCLALHDLVVEFLADPGVMDRAQRERVHVTLVANICARSGIDAAGTMMRVGTKCVAVRAVWELLSDSFAEHALPRLLYAGGAGTRDELGVLLFHWRFIAWRVKVGGGACGVYRADGRLYYMCRGGVGGDVLDRLATVVEGAMTGLPLSSPARLQQAAWEVMERFASRQSVASGDAAAPLLDYLCKTARSYLNKPAVELYGASRMGLPQERRVLGCSDEVRSTCSIVNASGEPLLFVGLGRGHIEVWDTQSGSRVAVLEGHTKAVICLAVLDGGAGGGGGRLVSGSKDKTVRVWDVDGGKCAAVLKGHTFWVTCLAVVDGGAGGGGRRLVSGSRDRTVRVWDVDGGNCVTKLKGLDSGIAGATVVRAAGSAAWAIDAACVFVDDCRRCFLLDGGGCALRHLPAPPRAVAVCAVSRGRVAWGTSTGQVLLGQLVS